MIRFIFPTGAPVAYSAAEFGAFCNHLSHLGSGAALKPVTDAAHGRLTISPPACWKAATTLRRVTAQTAIPGLDPFDRDKLAALITGLETATATGKPVTITDVAEPMGVAHASKKVA